MVKDRVVACKSYMYEGGCSKGRKGTFWHFCQKCSKYDPIPGGHAARPNLIKEKKEKFAKDKRNWGGDY